MATVDMRPGNKAPTTLAKGAAATYGVPIKVIKRLCDLQAAATQKGSVLATGDVIKLIPIPTGSAVLKAGAVVLEAVKDGGSGAINQFAFGLGDRVKNSRHILQVAGGDATVATYVTPANPQPGTWVQNTPSSAATFSVNIYLGTYSGTVLTAGVIGVWALVADLGEFGQFNINASDQKGVPQA